MAVKLADLTHAFNAMQARKQAKEDRNSQMLLTLALSKDKMESQKEMQNIRIQASKDLAAADRDFKFKTEALNTLNTELESLTKELDGYNKLITTAVGAQHNINPIHRTDGYGSILEGNKNTTEQLVNLIKGKEGQRDSMKRAIGTALERVGNISKVKDWMKGTKVDKSKGDPNIYDMPDYSEEQFYQQFATVKESDFNKALFERFSPDPLEMAGLNQKVALARTTNLNLEKLEGKAVQDVYNTFESTSDVYGFKNYNNIVFQLSQTDKQKDRTALEGKMDIEVIRIGADILGLSNAEAMRDESTKEMARTAFNSIYKAREAATPGKAGKGNIGNYSQFNNAVVGMYNQWIVEKDQAERDNIKRKAFSYLGVDFSDSENMRMFTDLTKKIEEYEIESSVDPDGDKSEELDASSETEDAFDETAGDEDVEGYRGVREKYGNWTPASQIEVDEGGLGIQDEFDEYDPEDYNRYMDPEKERLDEKVLDLSNQIEFLEGAIDKKLPGIRKGSQIDKKLKEGSNLALKSLQFLDLIKKRHAKSGADFLHETSVRALGLPVDLVDYLIKSAGVDLYDTPYMGSEWLRGRNAAAIEKEIKDLADLIKKRGDESLDMLNWGDEDWLADRED